MKQQTQKHKQKLKHKQQQPNKTKHIQTNNKQKP